MIQEISFRNVKGIQLKNDYLTAVVLPEYGGKVVSLAYLEKELLFQNPRDSFQKAYFGADFSQFEACGFDEAFPTVDPCTVTAGGKELFFPDHGEIWSAGFAITDMEENRVTLSYESLRLSYCYEKTFSLEENRLVCRYKIKNKGEIPLPAIWVLHALMRDEDGMEILLPDEVKAVVNTFDHPELGDAGTMHSYPVAIGKSGKQLDLRRMPETGMWKFYAAKPVKEGWCAYHYPISGLEVMLRYDSSALPYLGFWATSGGYRGDYNCALEPASGFYDNAELAEKNGTLSILQPQETASFYVTIQVCCLKK